MLRRILTSESKTVTGAAVVIAAATLMSRIIGIVRDHLFAKFYATGPVMDAYYAAFRLPDLIYNLLIVGALTAGFIPTFTKLFFTSENKSEAWKLANNIINIAGSALIILCGLGIIFTPTLATIIAPGFSGDTRELVITFTRIMFTSPLLLGVSMVMGGIVQSLKQFVLYSIAPIFYNLGIIVGILVFTKFLGTPGLAWGVVFGAFLHVSIQVYGAYHSGYRWRWEYSLRDKNTLLIAKLMIPRTLGLAVTQLNTVIVTVLASFLPVGSVAVYNYANNLQAVPTGIIGIPFALAVFPVLSKAVAQNNGEAFIKNLAATTRQILFLVIPASVLVLLLRAQIVRVILGSGEFGWDATIATANALAFFAFGLFAQALIPLFARAFYAISNTKTPFVIGIIAELVSIIAALLLMKPLGVAGLALAASIGAILNIAMLAVTLRQTTGSLEEETGVRMIFKVVIGALCMAAVVQGLKYPLGTMLDLNRFYGILLQGLVAGILGILTYGVVCYLLRVEEMIEIKNSLERRWLSLWNVPAGIDEAEKL